VPLAQTICKHESTHNYYIVYKCQDVLLLTFIGVYGAVVLVEFSHRISSIIDVHNIKAENFYNADETGVNYENIPKNDECKGCEDGLIKIWGKIQRSGYYHDVGKCGWRQDTTISGAENNDSNREKSC
jgi:hypothetical protein